MRWQPDIFGYTDYRAYLRDVYDAAKAGGVRGYSFRGLARRAGFSSPNFIKLVMDGARNLGPGSVQRVARAFGLDDEGAAYFECLVAYGQAETADDRYAAWDALAATARFRAARRISGPLFAYLAHWYMPVVRELAARADFRDDAAWVAQQLLPAIDEAEAADALEFLKAHGLIVAQPGGGWARGDASLTTGHEPRDMAVTGFHRQMLARASESLTRVPSEARNISALTVCVSPETAERIRDEIHGFRARLLELCDRDEAPSQVHQINFQMFPLSGEAPK